MDRGHTVEYQDYFGSVVVAIERDDDGIMTADGDYRRDGAVDGF